MAPGEIEARLQSECNQYTRRIQERSTKHPPTGHGILIIDEVKVAAGIHWSSRDDSIVRFAMTSQDMSTLQDLYMSMDEHEGKCKTTYVLQMLWQNLTSDLDIMGPYYTSDGPFDAKFMLACVLDSMRKFHMYGFKVCLLICDGASSNLTMCKTLMNYDGVFLEDRIKPQFTNPFSGQPVHMMICPTHQVC